MKNTLIFLLAFILNDLFAQEPTFPESDASWITTHTSACIVGTLYKYCWTEYLYGDTIIEGKTYTKLILQKHCVYANAGNHCVESYWYPKYGDFVMGGILEENGRVIFKKFNVADSLFEYYDEALKNVPPNEEIVFYDMNWEVGDSITYPVENGEIFKFDVSYIQEQNGKKKFRLQLRGGAQWMNFIAVEGMGGTMGLFNMYYPNLVNSYYLTVPVCFYHNGELIQEGEYCTNLCEVTNTQDPHTLATSCIFPNPVIENLYVNLGCLNTTSGTIVIRNYLNEILHTESFYNPNLDDTNLTLGLQELPFGIYFITIYSKDALIGVKKFIVGK